MKLDNTLNVIIPAGQGFSYFYVNRRLTTAFTKVRHWSLSWASWI